MVDEYIRDFEQLQMRVELNEEPKLTMMRFIKGPSLTLLRSRLATLTFI